MLFALFAQNSLSGLMNGVDTLTSAQWARKFRKVLAKKLVTSNKSSSRKNLGQIPFFTISKMAKNQYLNRELKFKTAQNAISQEFFLAIFGYRVPETRIWKLH